MLAKALMVFCQKTPYLFGNMSLRAIALLAIGTSANMGPCGTEGSEMSCVFFHLDRLD